MRELIFMAEQGFRSVLFFCVQLSGAKSLGIASDIDPIYANTLRDAINKGVEVIAWRASFNGNSINLQRSIDLILD